MFERSQEKKVEKLVLDGGKILRKYYGKILVRDIAQKKYHELVTKADLDVNELLVRGLSRLFPQDDLVSEEGSVADGGGVAQWVIDPLDGTSNFVSHVPLFSVSVARVTEGEVVWGMIYAPLLEERYVAVKDKGATLNGRGISVSDVRKIAEARMAYGYSHEPASRAAAFGAMQKMSDSVASLKHLGSASLELAYVACGRLDAAVFYAPTRLWDIAAGALMVKEAGGMLTSINGRSWHAESEDLLASNKKLHAKVLGKIR